MFRSLLFSILAMETLADAMENSEIILICMSDSYKRDNYCQAQAECALISKRVILPVVVHSGYKPDGWLNTITQSNMYIDFGTYEFKVAFDALLREVKQRQNQNNTPSGKPLMQTSANIVRNPSAGSIASSNRSQIPTDVSDINRINQPSISSLPPTILNRQQQQQQQGPVNPNPRSSTPAAAATSTVPPVTIGNKQQTSIPSYYASSIPGSQPPTQSAHVNGQKNPSSKPLSPGGVPSSKSNGVAQKQEIIVSSSSRSSSASSDSSNPTLFHVKKTQFKPVQPNPGSARNTTASPAAPNVNNKQQQQTSVKPTSRTATPAKGTSTTPVVFDRRQQQPTNSLSRTSSNSGIHPPPPPPPPLLAQSQQKKVPLPSNSRSTTPAGLSTNLQVNGQNLGQLSEQYTNRNTNNAIYHNTSINLWSSQDVLDYLCDAGLYPMMPLCESMSGKALLQLFRLCQKKPTRLYDQLNEELRIRFNGLTLSMGIYTQFLTLMEGLVGPRVDELLSPVNTVGQNVTERVIIVPHGSQQSTIIQTTPISSIYSASSATQPKNPTPIQLLSGTSTPRGPRIVERAVYRPASNIGRPYNFIVESVEEPATLLGQVQRYGNQLMVLDETTRRQHETSNVR